MVHPDWYGYQKRFAASEWYQLFPGGNPRNTLTWRNRFANMPTSIKYHSFYSTGEDVLDTHVGTPWLLEAFSNTLFDESRFSWVFQEKWKGRAPVNGFGGTTTMGWGFNTVDAEYYTSDADTAGRVPLSAAVAKTTINDDSLRQKPFFDKTVPEGVSSSLFDQQADLALNQNFRREILLAKALPALTLPTGGRQGVQIKGNDIFRDYIDMNKIPIAFGNDWPLKRTTDNDYSWRHSDIKDVAYPYVYAIFNKLIQ